MKIGIVGLLGPKLGLELVSQINPGTASPFGKSLQSVDSVLTLSSMGGCYNKFSAP